MKKVLLILSVFVFGAIALPLFALTLDEYSLIQKTRIAGEITDDEQPLLIGNKITVAADDGHKIILQQVNPLYITTHKSYELSIAAIALCENETHIVMAPFYVPADYFSSPDKYEPKLERPFSYKYTTTYNFYPAYQLMTELRGDADMDALWGKYRHFSVHSEDIWLDIKDDISCGSPECAVIDQLILGGKVNMYVNITNIRNSLSQISPTKEGFELYNRLEDVIVPWTEIMSRRCFLSKSGYITLKYLQALVETYKDYAPDKEE